MKLQNLTVIFIIIIIPVILLVSLYITSGLKTLKYQSLYDTGLMTATHDAIYAFEQNSADDKYSSNPEKKRDILKSSIKMFEKSLANTCGISSYSYQEIEEYIPAIVFGMYDGFYMYAPSKEYTKDEDGNEKYEYKHNLKNYVYYSEILDDGTVIRYSLDNYVVVTGIFKDENGNDVYQTKGGYLAVGSSNDGKTYQGVTIVEETGLGEHSKDGINYYKESHEFTKWFLNTAKIGEKADYLKIGEEVNGYVNDPEDDNSAFVQHKRSIMKSKIEGVLNSSITAYSNRIWDKVYKMPKLSEEDWQKIYSNISMITFFQGKNIGLTKYNGYCVLNSTNSREYVNPNLMYFIDGNYYHDIRCSQLSDKTSGYRIGSFEKRKEDIKVEKKDEEGNVISNADGTAQTETVSRYKYDITALACYDCINGPLPNNVSLYDYVRDANTDKEIKISYFTSLGRERYNGSKPISYIPTLNKSETVIYNVKHYLQSLSNADNYELHNTESKTGEIGKLTEAQPLNYPGFTHKNFDQKIITENPIVTVEIYYTRNTNTAYKVEHWKQNINNSEYTIVSDDTQTLYGTTGALTNAQPNVYSGYNAQAVVQQNIAGDGSTVIKIKYDRIISARYKVEHYKGENLIDTETITNASVGDTVTAEPRTYFGYTVDTTRGNRTGVVKANNSLVLKVYYKQTLKKGDFVNYDAGTWSATDKQTKNNMTRGKNCESVGIVEESSKNNTIFGGFNGWRILSIDYENEIVKIIHAGAPEKFKSGNSSNKNSILGNNNYWAMYENPAYAVEGTAHCLTYAEANAAGKYLRKIGQKYWIMPGGLLSQNMVVANGNIDSWTSNNVTFGIRPVITLKSNLIYTDSGSKKTDTYNDNTEYTIWNIN